MCTDSQKDSRAFTVEPRSPCSARPGGGARCCGQFTLPPLGFCAPGGRISPLRTSPNAFGVTGKVLGKWGRERSWLPGLLEHRASLPSTFQGASPILSPHRKSLHPEVDADARAP